MFGGKTAHLVSKDFREVLLQLPKEELLDLLKALIKENYPGQIHKLSFERLVMKINQMPDVFKQKEFLVDTIMDIVKERNEIICDHKFYRGIKYGMLYMFFFVYLTATIIGWLNDVEPPSPPGPPSS
jgi:hypothetical protein